MNFKKVKKKKRHGCTTSNVQEIAPGRDVHIRTYREKKLEEKIRSSNLKSGGDSVIKSTDCSSGQLALDSQDSTGQLTTISQPVAVHPTPSSGF